MIALETEPLPMPNPYRARVPASGPALARIGETLDAFCAAEHLPDAVAWQLRVALDEIIGNIVAYGPAAGRTPTIEVSLHRGSRGVEIVVEDDGPAFDPLSSPAPDLTRPLEERQPGGLGIALVRSLMDAVRYERTPRNVLTLWKRITPDDPAGTIADDHHSDNQ